MPPTQPEQTPPAEFPGVDRLDALELHRAGVIPLDLVGLDAAPARFVDAEGVPVAEVAEDGRITWGSARSPRPFESLHRGPDAVAHPATLVDSPQRLDEVAADTRTLLVLASTDGDDSTAELALVRAARSAGASRDASVVVVPVGRRATRREEKVEAVRAAYSLAGEVRDLTGGPPADVVAGLVVFFTGLSGSGKSTLARAVHHRLVEETDHPVTLLDGDLVRRHLSAGLTFSPEDRDTNIRRIGWVAAEIARHGGTAICSPIAPFDATRKQVRQMVESRGGRFLLVHVATPVEECERRDRKGLYAAARRGEIADFTGISSPYEIPEDAELRLDTTGEQVEQLRDAVLDALRQRQWLSD